MNSRLLRRHFKGFLYFLLYIAILLSFGCTPQKRINRIVKKHPELATPDTVFLSDTITRPAIIIDTQFTLLIHDTIVISNGEATATIERTGENSFMFSAFVPADTIIKNHVIPYSTINATTPEAKKRERSYTPFLVGAFVGLFIGLLFSLKFLRIKKGSQ